MTRKKERRQRARLATADRTGTMGKSTLSTRAIKGTVNYNLTGQECQIGRTG